MIHYFRVDQPNDKAYITPELVDGRVNLSDDKFDEWLSVFGSNHNTVIYAGEID